MNIWAWVEAVQSELRANERTRLADLMDLVPHYMSDNMHEQLDAVLPEALALAREAKNPWIEVFLRHWNLQSRILQRYQVRDFLSEAVNLIDFANKEETKECPQSVCTTQDLANCYAHLDGPGYAKERLEVASETLSRINAEWPCFTCISGEYATALLDAAEAEKAIEFIEKQKRELIKIGRADRKDEMVGTHIDCLIAIGRLEEALAMNQRARDLGRGESFMEFRRLDEARINARLGRFEESKKHLLAFEDVVRTPSQYEPWAETLFHLAKGGAIPNDVPLHVELQQLIENMRRSGVVRRSINLLMMQARLALLRGRVSTAKRSAAAIRALIGELRAPLGAPDDLAELEREIEKTPRPEEDALPETAEALLSALPEDPELRFDLLERAEKKWSGDQGLALAHAHAHTLLFEHERAIAHLRAYLAEHSAAPEVVLYLLHTLHSAKRRQELYAFTEETLSRSTHPEVLASCHWVIALDADERGAKSEAKARLEKILILKPKAINTRLFLARIERETGDLESSLVHLDELVALDEEPGPWDWERILVGTLLDRWDAVRASVKRLGMNVEGEGPIDSEGELVRIELEEPDDDEAKTYYAIRTGPVTARIVEIAHPAYEQHYSDLVVFEPRPKNEAPKEGEEANHTFIYRTVAIKTRGHYESAIIDGAHPGEESLRALRQALSDGRCRLEVRSDASYLLDAGETGARLTGLYAFVAFPKTADKAEVHAILLNATRGFPNPLIWPELARAAGDEASAIAHAEIAERFHL